MQTESFRVKGYVWQTYSIIVHTREEDTLKLEYTKILLSNNFMGNNRISRTSVILYIRFLLKDRFRPKGLNGIASTFEWLDW